MMLGPSNSCRQHTIITSLRSLIWRLAFAALMLSPVIAEAAPRPGNDRPNIVFILVDDLGWSDLHCYGHAYHQTPNIDQLSSAGMRFTNGYSPAPICSASRASILTGKTVPRLGFEFVTKNEPGNQQLDSDEPLLAPPITLNLPLSEQTIAERLGSLGYETAFFGKWHVSQHYQQRYLQWHPGYGPGQQGFSVSVNDFGGHPYAWKKGAWKKGDLSSDIPSGVIPPDSLINSVVEYVRRPHAKPFFAMVSTYYVHTPVRSRSRWLLRDYADKLPTSAPNHSKRIEYGAFVQTLDHHVGQILRAIKESDQEENTLVVFMSDNGGHPEFCSNAPLRGSKWNLYEGGIRVPMIVRWPGKVVAGSTCDAPVIGYDMLPTFVSAAGGQANDTDGIRLDGLLANPREVVVRDLIWALSLLSS